MSQTSQNDVQLEEKKRRKYSQGARNVKKIDAFK